MQRLMNDDYLILAIDPGSRTLGLSVMRMDLSTHDMQVLYYDTLRVDSHLNRLSDTHTQYGEFADRLAIIRRYVYDQCRAWAPVAIAIEMPYMGRRPRAYGALKDVMQAIRHGCHDWLAHCSMFFYEPSVVKKASGVPGTSGDKTLMTQAMLTNPRITFADSVDPDGMDEHNTDATLIGYAHICLAIERKEVVHDKKVTRRPRRTKTSRKAKQ